MAAEGQNQTQFKDHKRGYTLFLALMKWGTILSAIVAFIVVFVIIA
ncbi:MAG: aa3-type cytochrome c oxidase subunit IV [Allosphingosinicella sp.]